MAAVADQRIQKLLAQAGLASRRAAEQFIVAGRVSVDGKVVTELGSVADPERQRIALDGRKISFERKVYFVLHKPRAVMCTLSDPQGRQTVKDFLKGCKARVVPVGRLDYHSSGVLLLTNDGQLSRALSHPSRGVLKTYRVKLQSRVDDAALEKFRQSIVIDGRPTEPARVSRLRDEGDKSWLVIGLHEGRNRQIRRLAESAGHRVAKLVRISYAGITTEGLASGGYRPLSDSEIRSLKTAVRSAPSSSEAAAPARRGRPGRASASPRRPSASPRRP